MLASVFETLRLLRLPDRVPWRHIRMRHQRNPDSLLDVVSWRQKHAISRRILPVQKAVLPSSQFLHRPSATLKGRTIRSPFSSSVTPAPTSMMTPMFCKSRQERTTACWASIPTSCPKTRPVPPCAAVLPWYMCLGESVRNAARREEPTHRSEPQIAAVVTFMITSSGCSILGNGMSLTETLNGPS